MADNHSDTDRYGTREQTTKGGVVMYRIGRVVCFVSIILLARSFWYGVFAAFVAAAACVLTGVEQIEKADRRTR